MSEFLSYYLTFGIGMYVGMALKNHKSFTGASSASLIRGLLLGIPFLPIGAVIQLIWILNERI